MIDSKHLVPNITSAKLLEIPQVFGWALSAYEGIATLGITEIDIISNNFSCSNVRLSLTSGDTTAIISVDILKNGTSIFEIPVSIDISGTTSVGATTPFLFTSSATTVIFNDDDKIDFVVSGVTDGLGLKVKLIGNNIIN